MDSLVTGAGQLVLGTVQWGLSYGVANTRGKRPDEAEIRQMLQEASLDGVTTLDTARAYGVSEEVIGHCLAGDSSWRVLTKLAPGVKTASEAVSSLVRSRLALRRERLDGVLLHRFEQRRVGDGAVWDALCRQRDDGRIARLGVSVLTTEQAAAALDDPEVELIQVAASLFDQRLARQGFFKRAVERRKEVFIRSAFLQGAALMEPRALPAHLRALGPSLSAAGEVANELEISRPALLLAYVRSLGANVIVGCESVEQVRQNLQAWREGTPHFQKIQALASSILLQDDHLLDPWRWPPKA